MLKAGIIGCGLMGMQHARALAQIPGVQVAAVQNRTRDKAEALAQEVGAAVYDTYEELLQQDLDAVWVCTPDHLHVEASKMVLESGKHLFLEKALATSLEDGAEIAAAGRKRPDLKQMVGYPLRFSPAFQKMKEVLSRPDAGKPVQTYSMRTHFLDPNAKVYDKYRDHYYETPQWYFKPEAKGPIFSHGSHDYDLFTWFCGDVESVFAYGDTYLLPRGSVADGFVVALRFKNGGVGQMTTPWLTRVEYDLMGVAAENLTVMNNNGVVHVKDQWRPEEVVSFAENDMWLQLNKHFVDCIREDRTPLISLHDGLKAISVADAAHRSLYSRKEVMVEVPL